MNPSERDVAFASIQGTSKRVFTRRKVKVKAIHVSLGKSSMPQQGNEPWCLRFWVSIIPLDYQDTRPLSYLPLPGDSMFPCISSLEIT